MEPHRNVQHGNCFFNATKSTLQMSQPTQHTYLSHPPSVMILSRSPGIPNPAPREALTTKAHFVHLKYQPIDKSLESALWLRWCWSGAVVRPQGEGGEHQACSWHHANAASRFLAARSTSHLLASACPPAKRTARRTLIFGKPGGA